MLCGPPGPLFAVPPGLLVYLLPGLVQVVPQLD
jgi:hypothetical protein